MAGCDASAQNGLADRRLLVNALRLSDRRLIVGILEVDLGFTVTWEEADTEVLFLARVR